MIVKNSFIQCSGDMKSCEMISKITHCIRLRKMRTGKGVILFLLLSCSCLRLSAQLPFKNYKIVLRDVTDTDIRVGAARTEIYFPMLRGQRIAVCANHTSMVGSTHLVDTLHASGMQIVRIFAPEHGFRGEAEAGKSVADGVDVQTGIPIVSLYGSHKKPTAADMKDIDIVLFDIQDVGARFYTYISTLHYIMEAAAENQVKVLVLDRPNPNGFWVDGPMLEPRFSSFVGMDPIPIAHGMTVGELARMINGEHWLKDSLRCDLKVINVYHYDHALRYQLPIPPSPNLQCMEAVYLYPSLCLFEGTPLSVGRGTDRPFCLLGFPKCKLGNMAFRPKSVPGAALHPPFEEKLCQGFDLTELANTVLKNGNFIHIDLLVEMYKVYPDKTKFFNSSFNRLAGTDKLQQQIKEGLPATEIRQSWQPELEAFKKLRKKYLLYADFE